MSDETPIENEPAQPDPPDNSSPFELPDLDVITKGDEGTDAEAHDGDA